MFPIYITCFATLAVKIISVIEPELITKFDSGYHIFFRLGHQARIVEYSF